MAIKNLKLAADFETTTDPADCRVWAACAVNIDTLKTEHLGNSIDGFFQFLEGKNTTVYFHNLKFDGEFILHYLLSHGFKHSRTAKEGCFDTLITDGGIFYSITVWFKQMNKKWSKAVIYDSLKKLPFSVAQIAKAFQLEDQKLSIDYDAHREPGHVLTEQEEKYVVADCRIVAQALQIQFAQDLKKMTNASDALAGFKAIVSKEKFEYWFPTFPVPLDQDVRRAYKGGYVYLKPEHAGKRGMQGVTFDVNSLYPSVMYDRLLPYGYPKKFTGQYQPDKAFPLYIQRLVCNFELKPGHLPTVQLKNTGRFAPTEYLTTSDWEPVELVMTNVDLEVFLDHYDVFDLEYLDGWAFRGARGMFKDYIDYWMRVKEINTGPLRQLAKLMLNSLYGKFATNPLARKKVPMLDHDGVVHYVLGDPEERDPVYTPMGAFITAYAREKTIRSGQSVYDRFIYADTDSLHLIGSDVPEVLDVHPTRLGAWKNEGEFTDSKFLRAKTYMETTEAGTKVTCAGMPDNIKAFVTYDTFQYGATFEGKLMPRHVPGGIVLEPTTFTIR